MKAGRCMDWGLGAGWAGHGDARAEPLGNVLPPLQGRAGGLKAGRCMAWGQVGPGTMTRGPSPWAMLCRPFGAEQGGMKAERCIAGGSASGRA